MNEVQHAGQGSPVTPERNSEGPWMHISVDMVTGLPDSHGHNAILMIVD